jgi:hypothetical protein
MEDEQLEWMKGTARETYLDTTIKRALSKYSFRFEIDGIACRAGYDPDKNEFDIEGSSGNRAELLELAGKIEVILRGSKPELDRLDLYRFLYKHLRAMMKVEQELQRAPLSERRFELLDWNPIDKKGVPLEEQCLFELIEEQIDRMSDDVTDTITAEMVEAKMKEKMRQTK